MRNTVIFAETATDQNIINNPSSVIYDEITYNNDPNNIRRNGIVSGEVMSTVLVNTTMRQNSIFAYFFTNVINDILTNYCGVDSTALQSAYKTITNESTAKSFADRYIGTVPSAPTTPNAVIPYLKQIDFILDGQQRITQSLGAYKYINSYSDETIEQGFNNFAQSVENGTTITYCVGRYDTTQGTIKTRMDENDEGITSLQNSYNTFITKNTTPTTVYLTSGTYNNGNDVVGVSTNITVNYTYSGNLIAGTMSSGAVVGFWTYEELRAGLLFTASSISATFPNGRVPVDSLRSVMFSGYALDSNGVQFYLYAQATPNGIRIYCPANNKVSSRFSNFHISFAYLANYTE